MVALDATQVRRREERVGSEAVIILDDVVQERVLLPTHVGQRPDVLRAVRLRRGACVHAFFIDECTVVIGAFRQQSKKHAETAG